MSRVKVTFEFNSADEAIVFLGKQVDNPTAAVVVERKPVATPPQQPPAESKPAGEKRGRGRPKKVSEGAAGEGGSSSPAQASAAPATEAKPAVEGGTTKAVGAAAGDAAGAGSTDGTTPPSTSPASAAAVPSKEDLVAAMQGVLDNKSVDAVMAILGKYNVEGAAQLPEDKRAEFIAYCGKVAKGEIEAGK